MRWLMLVGVAVLLCSCVIADDEPPSSTSDAPVAPLSAQEQALIFAADGAAQHGNPAAAERDYLSAMALSNGRIDAHLGLAQLYLRTNEYEKARSVLDKALDSKPTDPLANYLTGKLYIDTGEYSKAGQAFRQGLKSKPDDLDLCIGLGISEDMQGRHADAQAIYLRTMQQNASADLTHARTNLAMSYILSNQAQRAVDLLKEDAQKPEGASVTRHNLALAYGMLGRDAEAKEMLRGEVSEASRLNSLKRLKDYLAGDPSSSLRPAVPAPVMKDIPVVRREGFLDPGDTKQPLGERPAPVDAIPADAPAALKLDVPPPAAPSPGAPASASPKTKPDARPAPVDAIPDDIPSAFSL